MITKLLFFLIQWTWGLPQNLAGLILYLINDGKQRFRYNSCRGTVWDRPTGLSLGSFLFVCRDASERLIAHEYGHSLQSLILGPLYLPLIGTSSYLWCNDPRIGRKWREGEMSYYSFLPERWADSLGNAREKEVEADEKVC